jgi:hypothetical protein
LAYTMGNAIAPNCQVEELLIAKNRAANFSKPA